MSYLQGHTHTYTHTPKERASQACNYSDKWPPAPATLSSLIHTRHQTWVLAERRHSKWHHTANTGVWPWWEIFPNHQVLLSAALKDNMVSFFFPLHQTGNMANSTGSKLDVKWKTDTGAKIRAEKRQDAGRHPTDTLVRNPPRDILMAWTEMGWWRRGSCCCRLCPQFPAKSKTRRKTEKKLNQCLNWNNWVLGYNCETNRWPGQTLFLPVLLMIEVIVTWLTVWFMWEREQHDNSCTALSSRDEVETLAQMGIWHELVLKRSHIPPSFRSLFLSRAPGKQLRTVNYRRDSKKRFSKQHFYFPAIASC